MRTGIRYNYKKVALELLLIVANGVDKDLPMRKIETQLYKDISRFVGETAREKNRLVREGIALARRMKGYKKLGIWQEMFSRRDVFDNVNKVARRIQMTIGIRTRRLKTKEELSNGVFFMCSIHSNPADDHKDLQGNIFVNRHWRTMVDSTDYNRILSYIRNHRIMTVQEIMGEPYWLGTRPYCKHYFIKLDVADVLSSSIGKLRREVGVVRYTPYTTDDYYSERSQTYSRLNNIIPCKAFEKMSQKNA